MADEMISLGAKLAQHAGRQPDRPAISCGADTLSFLQLHRASNRLARGLASSGVRAGHFVVVGLPNGIPFVVVCHAVWKLGATPLPVSYRSPDREVAEIANLADAALIVGDFKGQVARPVASYRTLSAISDDENDLADIVPPVLKAVTSGGSTGKPKLILAGGPGVTDRVTPAAGRFGIGEDTVALLPGPLYHNGPFIMMTQTIASGGHAIVMPRFDARQTLAEIDRWQPNWLYLVPTMMIRIWRLPEEVRQACRVDSVRALWHMAAPCPPWLKEAYIGWFPPGAVMELYSGTEAMASTVISGEEWLVHRGSVGRVVSGEMKIVDEEGHDLPPGMVGEIWMRRAPGSPETYRYIGATARSREGGWESIGDLGWFDEDGYLYLADRKADMILVGGANVYPAEVEAAIEEHPHVLTCVVIGLPDSDLGSRVHAILNTDAPVSDAEMQAHLASRLVTYKRPRSYEIVEEPLRNDAGKVRRSALHDARAGVADAI